MAIRQIGIDIGKNTFHVIALGPDDAVVLRRQFTRSQLIRYFEERAGEPLDVAFEACSGAHWLAHRLIVLGHRVRLLTPESVRPFAKAQKNDWNDALAIAEAARRPGRHAVGIKSVEQLDMQALHRVRQRLVTGRTAIINQLRGLLRERGLVIPGGRLRFERYLRERLLGKENELSPVSRALFATLITEYATIDARIAEIDHELEAFARSNPICRALLPIPGIGVIVATALFSAVANIADFRSGRDLAAFLGLVPRQRSTGARPCCSASPSAGAPMSAR
jgi:transposase